MLGYFQDICSVTDVPVSADMQEGFGDSPEQAAQTIIAAAKTGLVGGSLEDARGNTLADIYDIGLATARIVAASEAAKSLDFKFMLTARTENYLYGNPNIHDTIKDAPDKFRLARHGNAGGDARRESQVRLHACLVICNDADYPQTHAPCGFGENGRLGHRDTLGIARLCPA
jgi:2-methylisocitrate lyase-like PEP mutase family enzyme